MIPEWLKLLPLDLIVAASKEHKLDWDLVASICYIESAGNALATRFEPGYRYLYHPSDLSRNLSITLLTEEMFQKTSYGLMQIMGGVAREHGFKGHLVELVDPKINLHYACLHLRKFYDKYTEEMDVVASYNAGSPRRTPGMMYINQRYVDKVSQKLRDLRRS